MENTKEMKYLRQLQEEFGTFSNNRVIKLYNKLYTDGILQLQHVSLESRDTWVTEIKRVETTINMADSHFIGSLKELKITQYICYFWEEIISVLTITDTEHGDQQFLAWFKDLMETSENFNSDLDNFVVEWEEVDFHKMWNCMESEELV